MSEYTVAVIRSYLCGSILPGRLSIDPTSNLHMSCKYHSMHVRHEVHSVHHDDSPQDFVPAVAAAVPLTAVQVADADLLKSKRRSSRRHPSEGSVTAKVV